MLYKYTLDLQNRIKVSYSSRFMDYRERLVIVIYDSAVKVFLLSDC